MIFSANRQIKILSLSFLFIFFGFAGVERYVTAFFSENGGVNVGFYSLILIYLFFLLFDPLSAIFVSKYGAKKCMIFGSLFYSLFILSLPMESPALVYVASALLGIGTSFLWTGQNSYLVRVSDEKFYGASAGFFSSFQSLGAAVGVLFLGWLIANFHFEMPFLIFSFFPLIGLLLLFQLKDVRNEEKISHFSLLKKSITSKTALKLSALWFGLHFVSGLAIGIIPIQIKNSLGITYIGILSSLFFVLPIVLSYFFGKLSDIRGRKGMVVFSYGLYILGFLSLYFSGNAFLLIIGVILLALAWTILRPITSAIVGDVTTKSNIEFLTALFWTIQNIGTVSALLLSQVLKGEVKSIYLISIFVIIISSVIFLPTLRQDMARIREKISKEVS